MLGRRRDPVLRGVAAATVVAVLLSALAGATPAPASVNTLAIDPVTTTTSVGDNFTFDVVGSSVGPVSGTGASVVFDPGELQIVSISKSDDWVSNGAGYAGYPSAANMAAFIASANAAGKVPPIAAFFADGSSYLEAGQHDLYSVTLEAIACGDSDLELPMGQADGGMLDGRSDTYGDQLEASSSDGSVSVRCSDGAMPPPSAGARSNPPQNGQLATVGSCPITVKVGGSPLEYAANSSAEAGFEAANTGIMLDLSSTSSSDGIASLLSGDIQVAALDRPLTHAEAADVIQWHIGDDVTPDSTTPLFLAVLRSSYIGDTAATETSPNVKAYDFVDYMRSQSGRSAIAAAGFVPAGPVSTAPIPDVDINLDDAVGLSDIGRLTSRWGQTSTCNGWIRADENNDGAVGLADIGKVTAHWGGYGFAAPPSWTQNKNNFDGLWGDPDNQAD